MNGSQAQDVAGGNDDSLPDLEASSLRTEALRWAEQVLNPQARVFVRRRQAVRPQAIRLAG